MPVRFSADARRHMRALTNDIVRGLMIGIASDPIALYEVVAAGPVAWRNTFLRDCNGLALDDSIADLVFKFFCEQVVQRHPGVADTAAKTAGKVLDKIEVASPPTAAEIDAAWVHEVASTEEGRRQYYRDGAGASGQDHKVIIRS